MVCFTIMLIACLTASTEGYQIFGKNANSYVEMQPFENQFRYGYQVRKENDQFQHKYQSPQNVTYGCYGYTQKDVGGEHRIYYVADQFGYRTVEVGQIVTIFPTPGKSPVAKQFEELPFPAGCFNKKQVDQVPEPSDKHEVIATPPTNGGCCRPCINGGKTIKSEGGMVTLLYPFRVACSEMEKFEIELNQLVVQFHH
uniref:Uncharacterized protein n=1 Tax=Anopheles stephensi TaxID=30069 RepID=A0A182XZW7_ANOST